MKKSLTLLSFGFAFLLFNACGSGESNGGNGNGEDSTGTEVGDTAQPAKAQLDFHSGGLHVYALENSPEFPNAKLELTEPAPGADLAEGESQFSFSVENFDLKAATEGHETMGLANSHHGQHIHFIVDNGPYSAHYEDAFKMSLDPGPHVLLAFLSRSWHESVKSPEAFIIRQFVVGTPEEGYKEANLSAPHMFYSRPKGSYKHGEYDKLLLDFFLLNTELNPEGNKVRATINGAQFTFTKWVPYVIEGLEAGEVKIKLELLDKDGNLVDSPYNPVDRTVTLEAAEM